VEELEERARSLGVSVEEYLMNLLLRGTDPVVGAGKYLRAAEELLEQARRELERGDLRQASEEIWAETLDCSFPYPFTSFCSGQNAYMTPKTSGVD